jgi:hypothetical protein
MDERQLRSLGLDVRNLRHSAVCPEWLEHYKNSYVQAHQLEHYHRFGRFYELLPAAPVVYVVSAIQHERSALNLWRAPHYIGSSKNGRKRQAQHVKDAMRDQHCNSNVDKLIKHYQLSWKYEVLPEANIRKAESLLIDGSCRSYGNRCLNMRR